MRFASTHAAETSIAAPPIRVRRKFARERGREAHQVQLPRAQGRLGPAGLKLVQAALLLERAAPAREVEAQRRLLEKAARPLERLAKLEVEA